MEVKYINPISKKGHAGTLLAIEGKNQIPFDIGRIYHIMNTPTNERRGCHAHKTFTQVAFCLQGSCKFLLDDGKEKHEITLNNPERGLLLEPMVWHEMYDFSQDCIISILANAPYDEQDYIRDYQSFLAKVEM
jgi:dTDP-4-dehydrorhamnose 3,5-epimerase-like enzyme